MLARVLITVYCIMLRSLAMARDSCEGKFDYLCGDVCIHQTAACHCGNATVEEYFASIWTEEDHYCCLPPGGDRQQCYRGHDGAGHCEAGRRLRTREQCHGECFNDYRNSNRSLLGARSQFMCDDGECVYTQRMCHSGYSACRDKSDLRECTQTLHCHGRPESFIIYNLSRNQLYSTSCLYISITWRGTQAAMILYTTTTYRE